MRDCPHDKAFGGEEKVLNRYLTPVLMIIDDMGLKHLPKRSDEYLFEIIRRRYETRWTIMTSNRPLKDWGQLIGDAEGDRGGSPKAVTAIPDRCLHHAEVITIIGKSYRLPNRARRNRGHKDQADGKKNENGKA